MILLGEQIVEGTERKLGDQLDVSVVRWQYLRKRWIYGDYVLKLELSEPMGG